MTDQTPENDTKTRIARMLESTMGASGLVLSKSFINRLAVDALEIAQESQDRRESEPTVERFDAPPGLHGEGWQTRAAEVTPQLPLPGWQERLAEAVRDVHDATSVTDIFEHPVAGPVYASGGYISQSQVYEDVMNGPNVPDPPLKPGEVRAWKNQDDEMLRETLEMFPDAEVVGVGVRGKSPYSWWLVLRGRGDT